MLTIDNEHDIHPTLFPDQTSQVWKLPKELLEKKAVHVTWYFQNEGEFLQLAQLKQLLTEKDIAVYLYLPYLPYGRQDKEISNETTFALRTFAELLNTLRFIQVTITDPHSEKALRLIKNSVPAFPVGAVTKALQDTKTDLVCYPDQGAEIKYREIYPTLSYIHGQKVRDPLTGIITAYQLIGDPKDKKVLIMDDICDGGATFVLLAKELLARGAKEVNLFVTHGIFSKGLPVLFEAGIDRIFTAEGEVTYTY